MRTKTQLKRKSITFYLLVATPGLVLASFWGTLGMPGSPHTAQAGKGRFLTRRFNVSVTESAEPHVLWPDTGTLVGAMGSDGKIIIHRNSTEVGTQSDPHVHLGTIMDLTDRNSDLSKCFSGPDGDGIQDATQIIEPDSVATNGVKSHFNVNALDTNGKSQSYRLNITGFDVQDQNGSSVTWDPLGIEFGQTWTLTLNPPAPEWEIVPLGGKKNACRAFGDFPHTIVITVERLK